MFKEIADLRFKPDEEGKLEQMCLGNLSVMMTPHHRFARGYYSGDESLKKDYIEWQISRGKDWKLKVNKFEHLLQSIRRKGLKKPITTIGNEIQSGHHRVAALAALGKRVVECKS